MSSQERIWTNLEAAFLFTENVFDNTGVINDPLGHTHSPGSGDHNSHATFVLFCDILKTGENNDYYRPGLWVGRADKKNITHMPLTFQYVFEFLAASLIKVVFGVRVGNDRV